MAQEFNSTKVKEENEQFRIIVKTYKGLEDVLAGELEAIGAQEIKALRRAVECTGDLRLMYLINLRCRTALKVLRPFYTFTAENPDELYENVKKFDWDSMLSAKNTIAIHSTLFSDNFTHSKFVTYRVKDAIVDWFADKYDERPSVRVTNPDFQFNMHIAGTSCTLSMDSSGESLHKRGWRKAQTEAPLSEVLAAGLIMKTGWDGNSDFYDPMCGSGTFLIEAAMIACNIAPGVYRRNFGFEKWSDFDADLFSELYNDDSHEKEFKYKIYGSDVSPEAVKIAEENIKNAGLSKYIVLDRRSFQKTEPFGKTGVLVTNPPYGERLKINDMKDLYGIIGERLKHSFSGFNAWILGYQDESFYAIGLRPSQKIEVKNGDLDCQFRLYELYDGSKKIHKEEERRDKKPHRKGNAEFQRDKDATAYEERLAFRRKNNPDEKDQRSEFQKRKHGGRSGDREKRPFDRDSRPDKRRSFDADDRSGKRKPFDRDARSDKRKSFEEDADKGKRKEYTGDDKWDRPEFKRKGRPGEAERRAEFDRRRGRGKGGQNK